GREFPLLRRRRLRRSSAWRRRRFVVEVERRVLVEHPLLEVAQLLARLDPELLDERATRVLVRGERFSLPSTAIEGEHELAAKPLAQRIVGDEALQFADDGGLSGRGEILVDPLLEAREAQLAESRDLTCREAG